MPVVSYGHNFEGGAHEAPGRLSGFSRECGPRDYFCLRDGHSPGAAPGPELGGRKGSLSTCRFTSCVGSRWEPEGAPGEGEAGSRSAHTAWLLAGNTLGRSPSSAPSVGSATFGRRTSWSTKPGTV